MHSSHSWEGFRHRLSVLDSRGTGVREVSDVLVPVVVGGFDAADQDTLRLLGTTCTSGAGFHAWVGFFGEVDLWIEQLRVEAVIGGLPIVFGIATQLTIPFDTLGASSWAEPPQSTTAIRNGPGGSASAPMLWLNSSFNMTQPWSFARPGLLLQAGRFGLIGASLAGAASFQTNVVLRET
jgi:hypothetical protein